MEESRSNVIREPIKEIEGIVGRWKLGLVQTIYTVKQLGGDPRDVHCGVDGVSTKIIVYFAFRQEKKIGRAIGDEQKNKSVYLLLVCIFFLNS